MEFGIIADSGANTTRTSPEKFLEWIRGMPGRSWLTWSFKASPRDRLQIATLRCTSCGHLELFAPDANYACLKCKYDRTGLPKDAPCPECGTGP
jgi:hypothetical protein